MFKDFLKKEEIDNNWYLPKINSKSDDKAKQRVYDKWNYLAANEKNMSWAYLIAELIEAYVKK